MNDLRVGGKEWLNEKDNGDPYLEFRVEVVGYWVVSKEWRNGSVKHSSSPYVMLEPSPWNSLLTSGRLLK